MAEVTENNSDVQNQTKYNILRTAPTTLKKLEDDYKRSRSSLVFREWLIQTKKYSESQADAIIAVLENEA